jgi:rare lipoprotein A
MSSIKFLLSTLCLCVLAACSYSTVYPPTSRYSSVPAQKPKTATAVPSTQRPYVIDGRTYYPLPSAGGYVERGIASWYGKEFHGRKTACGERYNMYAKTAAHKTLPINTMLLVRNLENGKEIVVRVNDRGPFVPGRIIDLTLSGARELDLIGKGTAFVQIEALGETVTVTHDNQRERRFLPHENFETGEFYVQVGSFANPVNAEKLKKEMSTLGGETVVQPYDNGDKVYYRVHVRAGNTLSAAQYKERVLAEAGYPGFVVAQ